MLRHHTQSGVTRCALTPNHSLTWQQTRLAWWLLCAVSAAIAGFWAVQGVWLIVPFAGVELLLAYVLLRRVCARSYREQELVIDADSVCLRWGYRQCEGCWQAERACACLEYWRPQHSWSPPSLYLSDGSRRIALAQDCPLADRLALLDVWRAASLPVAMHGETRVVAHTGFDRLS